LQRVSRVTRSASCAGSGKVLSHTRNGGAGARAGLENEAFIARMLRLYSRVTQRPNKRIGRLFAAAARGMLAIALVLEDYSRIATEQQAQFVAWVRSGPDPETDGMVR
jgi:hypothetical protein